MELEYNRRPFPGALVDPDGFAAVNFSTLAQGMRDSKLT